MIVLDTTVLVYAVGAEHALRQPCQEVLRAVRAGTLRATTAAEVVQEFCHVRARRRDRADAVALARAFATALTPLITIEAADLDEGLTLYETTDALGPFDAVLAATARRHGAAAIVSADRGFADVAGLAHLDPAAADFTSSLRELAD